MAHRSVPQKGKPTALRKMQPRETDIPKRRGDWKAVRDTGPGPGKLSKDAAAEM